MLDLHTSEHGYTEIFPPHGQPRQYIGTGSCLNLQDMFKIEGTEYYLIPTAEVPVTNLYRNEIWTRETPTHTAPTAPASGLRPAPVACQGLNPVTSL